VFHAASQALAKVSTWVAQNKGAMTAMNDVLGSTLAAMLVVANEPRSSGTCD